MFSQGSTVRSLVHIGEFQLSCRTSDYSGWLLCDGRNVSKAKYPGLYNCLTDYGSNAITFAGSNSSCFVLPDARGRVVGMAGQGSSLTLRTLGDVVGQETRTLTGNELPAHAHTGTTESNGAHAHGGVTGAGGDHSHGVTDPGHTHTQNTINDDFNLSGGNPPGFAGDSAGNRTWNNINASTTGVSVNPVGTHTHAIGTDGAHVHTFTTASTGAGGSFGIVQPTLFCANLFICGMIYIPAPLIG